MGFFEKLGLSTRIQTTDRTPEDCVKMVESFFRKVGLNPANVRLPEASGIGWLIPRGSAGVIVSLQDVNGTGIMVIVSPVVFLPEQNLLPFYRRCLEINMKLINCALAASEDKIYLVHERPIEGLDQVEFEGTLNYLYSVANDLSDLFAQEFNARPCSPPTTG